MDGVMDKLQTDGKATRQRKVGEVLCTSKCVILEYTGK